MHLEKNEYQLTKHDIIGNEELSQSDRNLLLRAVEFLEAAESGDMERANMIVEEIKRISEGRVRNVERVHSGSSWDGNLRSDNPMADWDGHPRVEDSRIREW